MGMISIDPKQVNICCPSCRYLNIVLVTESGINYSECEECGILLYFEIATQVFIQYELISDVYQFHGQDPLVT